MSVTADSTVHFNKLECSTRSKKDKYYLAAVGLTHIQHNEDYDHALNTYLVLYLLRTHRIKTILEMNDILKNFVKVDDPF